MPAKDEHHESVVNALKKDGWNVVREPVLITVGKRHLWIDIKARLGDQQIYVEVKGFRTAYSIVNYLYATIGQCTAYLSAIEHYQFGIPLYLAVPEDAFKGILSEELGQIVMRRAAINLLVFDGEREAVQQWLPLQA